MTIRAEVHSIAGIETHHLLRDYCRTLRIEMFDRLDDIGDEQFDKIFLFFVPNILANPCNSSNNQADSCRMGKFSLLFPMSMMRCSLYDIPAFQSFTIPLHINSTTQERLWGNSLKKLDLCNMKFDQSSDMISRTTCIG